MTRCGWVGSDPLYVDYHDHEWGVPIHDDVALFEFLILEGAQAGLSWLTILKKRADYRRAFDGFDPAIVARYNERKVHSLLENVGIVRNRLKIQSAISNAQRVLDVRAEFGSLDRYLWQFVDGTPLQNRWRRMDDVPVSTPISDCLSSNLKKRGFKFVGTTICYAFMQAVGMVNDHTTDCFRHEHIAAM